jgi:hypothetical protein
MENQCTHCEISEEERQLKQSLMCFRYYCEECESDRGGRSFCSKAISDYLFFGDED